MHTSDLPTSCTTLDYLKPQAEKRDRAQRLRPQRSAPPADTLSLYTPSRVSSDEIRPWTCTLDPARLRHTQTLIDLIFHVRFPSLRTGPDSVRNWGRLGSTPPNIGLQVRSSARASGPVRPSND